jgi:cytochrome b pre-mRNA-processing protein 6
MASTVSLWSTSLKPFKAHCCKIAKQYTRLLALWPKDALRPNLPFTRAIERRASPYGVKAVAPTAEASKAPSAPAPASAAASTPASTRNPQLEQAQVNALFSLLENRYSKKYPLSPAVFKPASAPEYYDRLMAEIEAAPKKTWWQVKVDGWKNKIRWS